MRRQAGFTLVELMISSSIALIVLLTGIKAYLDGNQWYLSAEANAASVNSSMVLMDAVGRGIESSGGGSVRAWMSMWIENSTASTSCGARSPLPACGGADRLTVATAAVPSRECAIEAAVGSTQVTLRSVPTCCLTAAPRQVFLIKGTGWAQKAVTGFDSIACTLNLAPGPMAPNDGAAVTNWVGGVAAPVEISTYYLDSTLGQMHVFRDLNNNAMMDAGEDLLMADGVFDFQVGLGFDFYPSDGFITETDNGIDEVLYNRAGEVKGAGDFASVLPINLQAVVVGLITGGRNGALSKPSVAKAVLDGKDFSNSNWLLKRYQGRFTPRHTYLF